MGRKEENEADALNYLDKLFNNTPENGFSYPLVVKEVMIKYVVSQWFVEKSIKFFFLDTDLLVLEKNILKRGARFGNTKK